jgi:hypothetical protein
MSLSHPAEDKAGRTTACTMADFALELKLSLRCRRTLQLDKMFCSSLIT